MLQKKITKRHNKYTSGANRKQNRTRKVQRFECLAYGVINSLGQGQLVVESVFEMIRKSFDEIFI
jgi:hypothetical protein